jgi:hypothetical protein
MDPGPLQRLVGDPQFALDPLTEKQSEALDMVLHLAEKYELAITMQSGDITFVNNLSNMHRRRPFEDKGRSKRHLLRLWLHNDDLAWDLPDELTSCWNAVFGVGDIDKLSFPVEPNAYYKQQRINTFSASSLLIPEEFDQDEA